MTPNRRRLLRAVLRERQGGLCCYCGVPMTPPTGPTPRGGAAATIETIEHLHRKVDGGPDKPHNVALACHSCNTERGAMNWLAYASYKAGELTI